MAGLAVVSERARGWRLFENCNRSEGGLLVREGGRRREGEEIAQGNRRTKTEGLQRSWEMLWDFV